MILNLNILPMDNFQSEQIKRWLAQPEAHLFRQAIKANIAQVELALANEYLQCGDMARAAECAETCAVTIGRLGATLEAVSIKADGTVGIPLITVEMKPL